MSALEQALADYLQLRHSLGHELAEAGWLLPGFVAYLDAHGLPTVTIEAALAWAQQAPKSPAGRVTTVGPRRMTAARGFARYLSGIDAGTEVPPLGLMPRRAPLAPAVHLLRSRHRRAAGTGPPDDRLAAAGGDLPDADRAARGERAADR